MNSNEKMPTAEQCTHLWVWILSDSYNRDQLQTTLETHGIENVLQTVTFLHLAFQLTVSSVVDESAIVLHGQPENLRALSILTAAAESPHSSWDALIAVVDGIYALHPALDPAFDAEVAEFIVSCIELCRTIIREQNPAKLDARLASREGRNR